MATRSYRLPAQGAARAAAWSTASTRATSVSTSSSPA